MQQSKKYELMFILKPDQSEEEINKYIKEVKDLLLKFKAEDIKEDIWGKREFSYPILKYKHGFYVVLNFLMESEHLKKIEEILNIKESVIRYMITKDEKEKYIKKAEMKEEIKSKKRALRAAKEEEYDKQHENRHDNRNENRYERKPRHEGYNEESNFHAKSSEEKIGG